MLGLQASRRAFVRAATLGASAVLAGCKGQDDSAASPGATASVIPGYVPNAGEVAKWEGMVGQSFMMANASGTLLARLDSVVGEVTRDDRPSYVRQETFVAYFTAERGAVLGDQTYLASSATLGTTQLYLSSVGDRGGLLAVFG